MSQSFEKKNTIIKENNIPLSSNYLKNIESINKNLFPRNQPKTLEKKETGTGK